MSRLVLWLVVWAPLVVFSQTRNRALEKLSLGISVEVNYGQRLLRQDPSPGYAPNRPEMAGVGKIGGVVGINLGYALTPKLTVGTGLLFSDRGYATNKTELVWASPDATYPTHSRTTFSYYFVDIPIYAIYRFSVAGLGMYVTGGPSVGNLVYQRTAVITYFGNNREKAVSKKLGDGYMNSIFSFHAGFGVGVPVSDRFRVGIEPLYRRTLTSFSHHHESRRYFHSFGLNTRLSMKFKKNKL